jgi:hypothetical protein
MLNNVQKVTAAAALIVLIPAVCLAITPYYQDFEGLVQTDPAALSGDGWLVFGNVFDPLGGYLYGYGTFPAPNDGLAFCQVTVEQGGDDQGAQQLVVFSDYENGDHGNGNTIESNIFQEQTIDAGAVGQTWTFIFNAKRGNLEGVSTAGAFIKTLDPTNGWVLTNFIDADMTTIPETWGGYSVSITIDSGLIGQILQIGFYNTGTGYQGSGIYYDNISFDVGLTAVNDSPSLAGMTLGSNYPNPFNPSTRIEFSLERAGMVDLAVFDLFGRRVATLESGSLPIGDHHVVWDGMNDTGSPAPTGQYRYVLTTGSGRTSRSMMLLK